MYMNQFPQAVLATDLDGTWIPLSQYPKNQTDLQELTERLKGRSVPVMYVTGRHVEAVEAIIASHPLPAPDWIVCEVGATIYRRDESGSLQTVEEYHNYLQQIVKEYSLQNLRKCFAHVPALRLQEPFNQGRFKLSYYIDPAMYEAAVHQMTEILRQDNIPWNLISSIDPFNGQGLLDLLPRGVSKAFALEWWSKSTEVEYSSIVYAGDSGNDYAAFVAGFRAIVVGNANRQLAEQVRQEHESRGYKNRLHLATEPATSGVLEGCRAFGII